MPPRITIITPNFNGGRFLEATINSVLSQDYPNLQYIVIDGGSTDGSIDIIKKYAHAIDYWVSETDTGPAQAINKGIARADGEWLNWLNSDDLLLPGALSTLAKIIAVAPDAEWIVGNRIDINAAGDLTQMGPMPQRCYDVLFLGGVFFPQDATFLRRTFLDSVGGRLDEACQSIFDTELYLRMVTKRKPLLTTALLSCFRVLSGQISSDAKLQSLELKRHANYFQEQSLRVRFLRLTRRPQWIVLNNLLIFIGFKLRMLSIGDDWKIALPNFQENDFSIEKISARLSLF